MYMCKLFDKWLVRKDFKSWLKKDPDPPHYAFCKFSCEMFQYLVKE